MSHGGANSERALILAPHGRDAEIASELLMAAGRQTYICSDVTHLRLELEKGASAVNFPEGFGVYTPLLRQTGPQAITSTWRKRAVFKSARLALPYLFANGFVAISSTVAAWEWTINAK